MNRSLKVAREERDTAKFELENAQAEVQRLIAELFRLGWGA